MTELSKKALEIAVTQIGVEEEPRGSNWGKQVSQYLKAVRIGFPASWCAAVVYWVFREAAAKLGVSCPVPCTGGVLRMWQKIPAANKRKTPAPGYVFFVDYGKGLGHAGIVESVEGDYIHTLEGNTNDEGSREGFEYCRRKRLQKWVNVGYAEF